MDSKIVLFAFIFAVVLLASVLGAGAVFAALLYVHNQPQVTGYAVLPHKEVGTEFAYNSVNLDSSVGELSLRAEIGQVEAAAKIKELAMKSELPTLDLSYSGEGDEIALWSDSVAFKVNALYTGNQDTDVWVSAETSRGLELDVEPAVYHTVPGHLQDILITIGGKDVRNGDEVTVIAETSNGKKLLKMLVDRSSDKYTSISRSGLDGCGASGWYGRGELS